MSDFEYKMMYVPYLIWGRRSVVVFRDTSKQHARIREARFLIYLTELVLNFSHICHGTSTKNGGTYITQSLKYAKYFLYFLYFVSVT